MGNEKTRRGLRSWAYFEGLRLRNVTVRLIKHIRIRVASQLMIIPRTPNPA